MVESKSIKHNPAGNRQGTQWPAPYSVTDETSGSTKVDVAAADLPPSSLVRVSYLTAPTNGPPTADSIQLTNSHAVYGKLPQPTQAQVGKDERSDEKVNKGSRSAAKPGIAFSDTSPSDKDGAKPKMPGPAPYHTPSRAIHQPVSHLAAQPTKVSAIGSARPVLRAAAPISSQDADA